MAETPPFPPPLEDYARTRLDAALFAPNFEREEERLFAASLASSAQLLDALGALSNSQGAKLAVSLGFIEAMTPNAFADRHGDGHVIGLHTALLVTIADFALYAFTQRGFLPAIGDPSTETSPPPTFGEAPGLFLLDRTLSGGTIESDTDRHRVPNDATRHEAAIYLAVLMARFVWFHEWAHCARGHVDCLRAQGDVARLHEIPDPHALVGFRREEARDTDLRHAMELDADATALTMMLRCQWDGLEPVPGIRAFDATARIEMTVIAALLMAWLFEEYQRHMDTRNAVTHPAPRDRLRRLARAAGEGLAGHPAHDRARRSFDALRANIPSMPSLDGPPLDPAPYAAQLTAALAPYRFTA